MPRYRLILEYDGTPFVGWQRQDNGPSVQAALESAVKVFSGETVKFHAAGRTDAGVHALGMSVHFDLDKDFAADAVRGALNFHLKPEPIVILDALITDPDFHARFSCIERQYEYHIVNRRPPLALARKRAWRIAQTLNVQAMNEAAQALTGKRDFTTFRAAQCQSKSPIKSLKSITVERDAEKIIIRCAARSFLHHQVRSIAGSLVEVGKGRWAISGIKKALEARDRSRCGPTAPAHGLYFIKASYGDE